MKPKYISPKEQILWYRLDIAIEELRIRLTAKPRG